MRRAQTGHHLLDLIEVTKCGQMGEVASVDHEIRDSRQNFRTRSSAAGVRKSSMNLNLLLGRNALSYRLIVDCRVQVPWQPLLLKPHVWRIGEDLTAFARDGHPWRFAVCLIDHVDEAAA